MDRAFHPRLDHDASTPADGGHPWGWTGTLGAGERNWPEEWAGCPFAERNGAGAPDVDLGGLARWLARTPCSPLYKRHISPDRELHALADAHPGSRSRVGPTWRAGLPGPPGRTAPYVAFLQSDGAPGRRAAASSSE